MDRPADEFGASLSGKFYFDPGEVKCAFVGRRISLYLVVVAECGLCLSFSGWVWPLTFVWACFGRFYLYRDWPLVALNPYCYAVFIYNGCLFELLCFECV